MFRITFTDPGMHDKTVEVKSESSVRTALIAHNQDFTSAVVFQDEDSFADLFRFVGDPVWRGRWKRSQFVEVET